MPEIVQNPGSLAGIRKDLSTSSTFTILAKGAMGGEHPRQREGQIKLPVSSDKSGVAQGTNSPAVLLLAGNQMPCAGHGIDAQSIHAIHDRQSFIELERVAMEFPLPKYA